MSFNTKDSRRGGFYFHPQTNRPYITVTTAEHIVSSYFIDRWQQEQIWTAMVNNPNLTKEEALQAPRTTLNLAANRGLSIHDITEKLDEGKTLDELDQTYRAQGQAWLDFKNKYDVHIVESELTMYSDEWGFAGTLDRVVTFGVDPEVCILDIKSNKNGQIYPDVAVQVSAYKYMYNSLPVPKPATKMFGWAVDLQGKWQLKELYEAFDQFLARKHCWEWENKSLCEDVGYYDWFEKGQNQIINEAWKGGDIT